MNTDLCLDFANTAGWHAGPHPEETLTNYSRALDWAVHAEILTEAQGASLLARATADPQGQAEALLRIVAFREAVYRLFSALAHCRAPEPGDLELLNREWVAASSHLRLESCDPSQEVGAGPCGGGSADFAWSWTGIEDDLASMLWPVVRAASTLLTSSELARVRECADDCCGWLFLDTSRNASRRWCDMADCGNRAKARRYRERKKGESAGAA